MRTFLFSLTLVVVAALIGTNSYAQCASMPVITASGPTTFCLGNSVTLTASASGSWTRRADVMGGARSYAASFSIGNKGYFAGGGVGYYGLTAAVWQFDATTNTWSQVADFGGNGRSRATAFAIGNKGYMGCGYNPGYHNPTSDGSGYLTYQNRDFWEYDPSANTWTRKADLPSDEREYATGFAIGEKGYVGLGRTTVNQVDYDLDDFWEYDPSTDTWTRKRNFQGALTVDVGYTVRESAVGFAIGTKGYVGTGYGKDDYYADATLKNSFWEFDPIANKWTKKADFGGTARSGAVGFSLGSKGYIGTGNDGSPKKDFWEYDPGTDKWIQRIDFGGAARNDAAAFTIGSKAYIGTGNGSSGQMNDFWEYNPGNYTYSWSPGLQTTPSIVASSAGDYKVTVTSGDGCSTVSSATTTVTVISRLVPPAIACYQTATFDEGSCRWVITGTQPAKPAMECYQTATFNNTTCSWDVAGSPPVITASGPTSFCSGGSVTLSTATGNSWTQKTSFGGTGRSNAVAFAIGNKAYIGTGFDGYWVGDFWEYDPAANTWTQKYTPNDFWRSDAVAFAIGGKGYMGTGYNNSTQEKNDFWEYDATTNIWTRKADFGGVARSNAVGFSIGSKGYIGTGQNGSTYMSDFWEYDPATDAWTRKADFGGGTRFVATGFSIGSKGYLGTGYSPVGSIDKSDFWEYDPATNAWTRKADFGGGTRESATGFSIGTKGYIGAGYGSAREKTFWEYDPDTNAWTKKADFGGTARSGAAGFSIGTKGYMGLGSDGSNRNDFWEYDPRVFNYSSYSWSPEEQTTPSIVVNSSGSYSITTTYSTGCTATSDPMTVTVNELTAKPEKVNCWDNYQLTPSCTWVNLGTQPTPPTTACYQTATFNTTTCSWDITGTQPAEPNKVNCWDKYQFNTTSCTWENMGTQAKQPGKVNCWDNYQFNTTSCTWVNMGNQPTRPTTACYQTATFNTTSCQWDVTAAGEQYPIYTFNPSCTGSAEVITVEAWAGEYSKVSVVAGGKYTFSSSVPTDYISIANSDGTVALASGANGLVWVSNITGIIRYYLFTNNSCGTQNIDRERWISCGSEATPPAITNVTVPSSSCVVVSHTINADINTAAGTISSVVINYNNGAAGSATMSLTSGSTYTGTIPAGTARVPVTWSITAASSNGGSTTVTGSSYTDGVQPAQPATVNCWDDYRFNTSSCTWVNAGSKPTEPAKVNCWDSFQFNTTTCTWVNAGSKPTEPAKVNCWDNFQFNTTTCTWVNAGSKPTEPAKVNCWDNFQFNTTTCTWVNQGSKPTEPAKVNCWDNFQFNTTTCTWVNIGTQPEKPATASYQTATFNTATCQWDITGTKPIATVVLSNLSQVYDGTAKTATATTTPAGLTVNFTYNNNATAPINAGSYNVTATVVDANYQGTVNGTLVITKANATIVVTPYSVTYDGNAHTATYTAKGVKNEDLTGVSLNTTHTTASTYSSDSWSFTDATGNYNDVAATTITDAIGKADPTISVTPYSVTYDGNAHTATGTAKGVKGEALAGLSLSGTTHTAAASYTTDSWSFTDVTGNYKNVAATTITDKINPLAITITPNPGQYKLYSCQNDPVITFTNSPALIGTDVFSGVLSRVTPTITNAGTYAITLGSLTAGSNYVLSLSTTPVTFEIKRQSAKPAGQAFYTGASVFWTPNSTSNTATLTLSATLQNTGLCGDIRTAKVSFMVRNGTILTPINGAQNLPVGLVNSADQSVGTASTNIQYSVNGTTSLDIAVIVTGNYTANNPAADAVVTVAIPKPGGQILGDGYVCNTATNSSGYVKGAPGSQSWFGFNVQYTKSLKNLQGGVDLTVISMNDRNGTASTTPHTYKFRSNAISTLSVTSPTASFTGKANVTEVLTDGTEQSVEGNCTMQLDITDNGSLTPSTDKLGITIYRAKGGVWYSNNWDGTRTTQAAICYGDLSTTGASSTTSPAITTVAVNAPSVAAVTAPQLFSERFSATAYPNPSVSHFTIKVSSGNTKDPITLRVIDELGRLVEVKNNLAEGQTIQIGQAYHSGVYFVDVMQGNTRRQLKLIKNK